MKVVDAAADVAKPVSPLTAMCIPPITKQTNRCSLQCERLVVKQNHEETNNTSNIFSRKGEKKFSFFLHHLFYVSVLLLSLYLFLFRINLESTEWMWGYSLVPEVPCKSILILPTLYILNSLKEKCFVPVCRKQKTTKVAARHRYSKPELGYFFTHNFKIQAAFVFILSFLLYVNTISNEYALDDGLLIKKISGFSREARE